MRLTYLAPFLFFALFACTTSEPVTTSDQRVIQTLDSLLNDHEYFLINSLLNKDSAKLSRLDNWRYQAIIKNAFNKNTESDVIITKLLSDKSFNLPDSQKVALLFLKRDNCVKLYQYREAAEIGDMIIEHTRSALDSGKIKHIRNLNILYRAVADVPPQHVQIKTDQIIPWTKDMAGLITIPVRTDSNTYDFVFDTRASVSTITRTFAEKLKLRIVNNPYEESSGITGNKFMTYPAVADSLRIGDLLVQNVIFQVVPDDILSFPSIQYQIKGIIGFPVIKQWREVQIKKNGTLEIPLHPKQSSLRNLAFDESTTVVNLKTDVDTLSFHFDTGATSTMLYYNYLKKYSRDVALKAKKETTELGGAGGTKTQESFVYPTFTFHIGNREVLLKDIQILSQPSYSHQKYHGNIGQDLLNNFEVTILNFEDMYFALH